MVDVSRYFKLKHATIYINPAHVSLLQVKRQPKGIKVTAVLNGFEFNHVFEDDKTANDFIQELK